MKRAALLAASLGASAICGCGDDSGINSEALFESRCSVCHSTVIPKNARKTRSQWDSTVDRMMHHGAKLSPTEKKVLVRYLSQHYRP